MSCGRRFFRHAGAQPLLDRGEEDERRHVRAVGDEVSVQRADVVEQSLGRARRRRAAGGAAAPELREDVCTLGQQVSLQLLAPRGELLDQREDHRHRVVRDQRHVPPLRY